MMQALAQQYTLEEYRSLEETAQERHPDLHGFELLPAVTSRHNKMLFISKGCFF